MLASPAGSPGPGTVGESSQSARPEVQACLVRPRLMAALADDDDASRSSSPQKVPKRADGHVSWSSETHAHKLVELENVVRERDKLLEERQKLEELLSTSISEAAALRQRLVESDALVAHATRGCETAVATTAEAVTTDAVTAAERLSLQLLVQEAELGKLQETVKLQTEKLQAAEIAQKQPATRKATGAEQDASALEEAEEAAEKANDRCATFGRMVERLERKALADELLIRELQSHAAGREEEMAVEVACGEALQERIDAQEAKLLEKDSLLLQRQRELSRLQTELDVAKTSTFKSRARMVAAAGAMSQGNLLKREATPPTGAPAWSKCPASRAPVPPQDAPGDSKWHSPPAGEATPLGALPLPWVLELATSNSPSPLLFATQALRARAAPWSALARSALRQPRVLGRWNQFKVM